MSRFVESVRGLTSRGLAERVDRLPDGRTALLLRVRPSGRGDGHLVGPRTKALLKDAEFRRAVMVTFKPGCSVPFFGLPASLATDGFIEIDEVWGDDGRALVGRIAEAATLARAVRWIAPTLARRVEPDYEPETGPLARRAARLLDREGARVDTVAEALGVTTRHLRRAFAVNIGISPKRFAQSARLQRAARLARSSTDWSAIAAASGYYDQSHLIGEFRALVGLTPSAYVARLQAGGESAAAGPRRRARHA